MRRLCLTIAGAIMTCNAAMAVADDAYWVQPMREVHARFTGEPGTLALFGDSISVSLAFWAPLHGEQPQAVADLAEAQRRIMSHQRTECWREWRGPEFGNEGGMTIRWADENVDAWLERLNPETAVVMFGTNDLTQLEADEYESTTREVVQRCLANGTVVLLTTIPPRSGLAEKSAEFADVVREIARDLEVPLIDYHAEVLERRPDDWDGTLPQFRAAVEANGEYGVPTLIAGDGVHPSNPGEYQDFSADALNHNGFALRSYLTALRYAEVIDEVLTHEAEE